MTLHPDTPYPHRGEPDSRSAALTALTPPLQRLADDVAGLIKTHNLESAKIELTGETSGTITLASGAKTGLTVSLRGSLASENQPPTGTPYVAHYTGEFFWRPTPDSPDFVQSGDTVRAGQLVGWAMGQSKDMSFGLRAEQDGVIRIIAPHATKVTEGKTLLYYIEEQA